ncbi:MAG: phosphate transporter permease PstA [Actinomycetota bacterium]|jgi:phosphate transport system permease protein
MEKLIDLSPVERPANAQPWAKIQPRLKGVIALSSVLPAVIALAFLLISGNEFMGVLFTVFLPLQILAGGFAGFYGFGRRGILDGLLLVVTYFFATFVLVLLVSVLWSVIENGGKAISPHFFYQNNVYVDPTAPLEIGGVGHAIIGSFLIVGLATVITVPLGIATAVYITETQGKSRGLIRSLLQAMSGLPSVVAGLFIYALLIASGITQYAGFAGSLALIPLMLPTVSRVAEEALRLVPKELRNGALALGAPAWRAFLQVTLPAASSGIVTAVLLGVARVIGETAPLILTTFSANNTNLNIFEGGMSTLPTYLYNYVTMGFDTSLQRAWGAALVILILVGVLFAAARFATRSTPAPKAKKRK